MVIGEFLDDRVQAGVRLSEVQRTENMTPEMYKSLSNEQKAFADLLIEMTRQLKRIADILENDIKDE